MTKLDDLLSYDDGPARHRMPQRHTWLRVASAVAASALTAFSIQVILRALDYDVGFPIAFGAALAVAILSLMVNRIGAGTIPATLLKTPPRPATFEYVDSDGVREGVKDWELRLNWTGKDAVRFAAATQPALLDLIDERLRLRHGVSRATDPDRARALLGPELGKFVNEPVTRRPNARDLTRLVAAMEAL